MTERSHERRRRSDHLVRPALFALAFVAAGCSSSSVDVTAKGAAPTSTAKPAPRSTVANTVKNVSATTAPGDTSVTVRGATVAAPAAPAVDAVAILKTALDALRPAYDLTETVTVNGKVAITVMGRIVGPGSLLTLTSSGASVEYLEVPPKSWSREPGGSWAEMTDPVPVKAPLDLLAQASALTVTSQAAGETHLHATYDPAVFTTKDVIQAELVVGANGLLTASYPTMVADKPGSVDARLTPSGDPTPIAPPAP